MSLISDNYKDDQKIITECKLNPTDPKCACVKPEDGISLLQLSLFNPYICWYAPCKSTNVYKTSLMVEEEKRCNVNVCSVALGEVKLDDDGKLIVKNECVTSKNFNRNVISQELVDKPLRALYEIPNIFPNILFPIIITSCLILFL